MRPADIREPALRCDHAVGPGTRRDRSRCPAVDAGARPGRGVGVGGARL